MTTTDGAKTVACTIALSVALRARVDTCARESGCSRAEAIRSALRDWCDRNERDAARRARLAAHAARADAGPAA